MLKLTLICVLFVVAIADVDSNGNQARRRIPENGVMPHNIPEQGRPDLHGNVMGQPADPNRMGQPADPFEAARGRARANTVQEHVRNGEQANKKMRPANKLNKMQAKQSSDKAQQGLFKQKLTEAKKERKVKEGKVKERKMKEGKMKEAKANNLRQKPHLDRANAQRPPLDRVNAQRPPLDRANAPKKHVI